MHTIVSIPKPRQALHTTGRGGRRIPQLVSTVPLRTGTAVHVLFCTRLFSSIETLFVAYFVTTGYVDFRNMSYW